MFDVFTTMTSSNFELTSQTKKISPTTKISDLTPQHFNKIRLLYTLERSKFEVLKSLNILDIILQIFFVPIFKCRYTYTVNKATSEQLQVIKCKEKEFCFCWSFDVSLFYRQSVKNDARVQTSVLLLSAHLFKL